MKKNKTISAVLAVIITGLIACSASNGEKETAGAEATTQPQHNTEQLPAFAMTDASGNTVNLSSFKGKKVFVNIWATWCPPCRAEIPSIESLVSKVDAENAVFIMLSLDENFELAKNFATSKNLKVPVYYPAEKLPEMFNTESIPVTFIFNEKGDLVKQNDGAEDYDTNEYIQLMNGK